MDNDLVKAKKDNLQKLIDAGINPYPYSFDVNAYSTELLEKFSSLKGKFL